MRSRNIKPAFFKNEELGLIDPLARLLYIGLWCYCDRNGRFEWRPLRIKAEILPYDDCNINELLNILIKVDEIKRYEVNGKQYGFIPTFLNHQNPHVRENPSICPPFEEKHNLGMDEAQPRQCSARLNPESLILNPESLNPLCEDNLGMDKAQPRQCFSEKNDEIPYEKIIDHLNLVLEGGKYQANTPKTQSLIRSLWKRKYRLDDFIYVINVKAQEWLKDPKRKQYLRPKTLFKLENFESYINQRPAHRHQGIIDWLNKKGALDEE